MYDVELANRQAGQHFFDADTLRFFRSRIGTELYGGRYFVTSEQFNGDAKRLYTVREVMDGAKIKTIGEFQQYSTGAAARRAAMKLAKEAV
jgi:hypothetical protein